MCQSILISYVKLTTYETLVQYINTRIYSSIEKTPKNPIHSQEN